MLSVDDSRRRQAEQDVQRGHDLVQRRSLDAAEACFRRATQLDPAHPVAHNSLGWVLEVRGATDEAVVHYRRALELSPQLSPARRNLAALLLRQGKDADSLSLCFSECSVGPHGRRWLADLIKAALPARDLTFAGRAASVRTTLRWGSRWHPTAWPEGATPPRNVPNQWLSVAKLRHDAEQFAYLRRRGVLGPEFDRLEGEYRRIADHLESTGPEVRVALSSAEHPTIYEVYNRIVHVRETPRVRRALGSTWDAKAVEAAYLERPPGIVVVDDFLTPDALAEVRAFCLESTVWSANRFAHGRLGAFFYNGFNCPLLLQIAEEVRDALPRVIGDGYPLHQLWAFKNTANLPADATIHADFAAINVNFWITPADANLDSSTGGLVVYGVDAPPHWDFRTYNARADVIKPFLQRSAARSVTIPYRQNRAIIFNSDLFHATAEVRFDSAFENRRINVTMLYGEREMDGHHPNISLDGVRPLWRSPALRGFRRPR